jgi:hypothetical protein
MVTAKIGCQSYKEHTTSLRKFKNLYENELTIKHKSDAVGGET